jgi:deoxyribose-phosphate aldolase
VRQQVLECTKLGLEHGKTVKWIIEIAALANEEIVALCKLIKDVVTQNFDESAYNSVFVKSSTGFYITEGGLPNGATVPAIKLMLEASHPLPVKAAGGVRNYDEAVQMIALGVMRIGTSSAKAIVNGQTATGGY